MTWAPVNIQYPAESTKWMEELSAAKDMAAAELQSTGVRLSNLQGLASADLSGIGEMAKRAAEFGRAALDGQFSEKPKCIVVTPFQSGVGLGTGYQRFLSAPNLLQRLAAKLEDTSDPARPTGEQYALVILFLGTRFDLMAAGLSKFNALLPIKDLQRAERRALNLVKLEAEKLEIPAAAGTLPLWSDLPLESCTVLKDANQTFNGQLARLESYAANNSPIDDLTELAQRKAQQTVDEDDRLGALKNLLSGGSADTTMQARLIGPGDVTELRKQLLEGDDAPGHEWVLSSGMMLVGSLKGLAFVREMVGL